MNILELPIEESNKRFDIREKELNEWVHPMNRSNIDEWIAKDGKVRVTVDNTAGQFYMEEFDKKSDAIKRLKDWDEDLIYNQLNKW